MTDVIIVIPIFGAELSWELKADRAYESAKNQTYPCEVVVSRGETLMEARNLPVFRSESKQVVFLEIGRAHV